MRERRSAEVLITPERIAAIIRMSLDSYTTPDMRAAMRGALGDAAALCDALGSELIAQNTRGGRVNKRTAEMAAAFKRCGDEIWRMRETVRVTAQEPPDDAMKAGVR